MVKDRAYSRYTREAAALLAKQVQLGRKQRKWTGREVAALAGVTLFDEERTSLVAHLSRTDDKLALLPSAVRKRRKTVHDDF